MKYCVMQHALSGWKAIMISGLNFRMAGSCLIHSMAAKGFSAVFIANEPTANTQHLFSPSPRHWIFCTVLKFNSGIERIGWFASSILEKNDLNGVASLNESIGHFAHNMLCSAFGIQDRIEVQQKDAVFLVGRGIHWYSYRHYEKNCRERGLSLQDSHFVLSNELREIIRTENSL